MQTRGLSQGMPWYFHVKNFDSAVVQNLPTPLEHGDTYFHSHLTRMTAHDDLYEGALKSKLLDKLNCTFYLRHKIRNRTCMWRHPHLRDSFPVYTFYMQHITLLYERNQPKNLWLTWILRKLQGYTTYRENLGTRIPCKQDGCHTLTDGHTDSHLRMKWNLNLIWCWHIMHRLLAAAEAKRYWQRNAFSRLRDVCWIHQRRISSAWFDQCGIVIFVLLCSR